VSLDSEEAAREISALGIKLGARAGILVEVDVGFGRCGVADERMAVALARTILSLGEVEFRGLMFYPGHLLVDAAGQERLRQDVNDRLDRHIEAFHRAGIPVGVISGGSTPTAYTSRRFHGVNEIRPGMYIFNDRNMLGLGVATIENCALSVVVTVVSKAVRNRVIVDGGSKTFSSDRFLAGDGRGFGFIKEDSTAVLESTSEEHGHLSISHSERPYRIGEHLTIIPNHVCSTINLHDEIYGVRGETVETVWRVAARGKVT
jgi:D-serine deaminase-like pyridoxal phosphate-dependent protein